MMGCEIVFPLTRKHPTATDSPIWRDFSLLSHSPFLFTSIREATFFASVSSCWKYKWIAVLSSAALISFLYPAIDWVASTIFTWYFLASHSISNRTESSFKERFWNSSIKIHRPLVISFLVRNPLQSNARGLKIATIDNIHTCLLYTSDAADE